MNAIFKKVSLAELSQSIEKVTFEFWWILNLNCLKKKDEI